MACSTKSTARLVLDAAEQSGITGVVISPGSRNSPLIIEAQRRAKLHKHVIVDERSAAFTALGMAMKTGRPVMLVCTSGTAVLNYYPAVAEAFYAQIPLIVVSADRPPYRIDKGEGQTIRQDGVLKNHTAFSYTLQTDQATGADEVKVKEAFETALNKRLPVHLNVPFEEPLYETQEDCRAFDLKIKEITEAETLDEARLERIENLWKKAKRKLILVSQLNPGDTLPKQLERLAAFPDTVVLTENLSNVHGENLLGHIDRLIFPFDDKAFEAYAPDLLLTIGNNIISKKIKFLIRANKPDLGHWHAGFQVVSPDTFDALTEHFSMDPEMFLSQLLFRIYDWENQSDYAAKWRRLAEERKKRHDDFMKQVPSGDLALYEILSENLQDVHVHWGNSTVIRYAQLFDFQSNVKHYGNRGTSGIDGSFSTAVGFALQSPGEKVLHVTGDLAFLYDSNAMWQNFPSNLKVIVIRNGGGDIFRFIPGPSKVENFEDYFVVKPEVDLSVLSQAYGIISETLRTTSKQEAKRKISTFLHQNRVQILEIDTQAVPNAEILKSYFASLA